MTRTGARGTQPARARTAAIAVTLAAFIGAPIAATALGDISRFTEDGQRPRGTGG